MVSSKTLGKKKNLDATRRGVSIRDNENNEGVKRMRSTEDISVPSKV